MQAVKLKFSCHTIYSTLLDVNFVMQLLDELEDQMSEGGNLLEYHSCELFPERWIDAVFVLRTDNGILYDRLEKRYRNEFYYYIHKYTSLTGDTLVKS